MNKLIALVILVSACGYEPGVRPSQAQSSGGGLTQVRVLDGGICSGLGLKGNPLDCTINVDNVTVTGTGAAGDGIALSTDSIGFAIFGDGADGDSVNVNLTAARDSFYNDVTITADTISSIGATRAHINGTLVIDAQLGVDPTISGSRQGTAGLAGSTTIATCTTAAGGGATSLSLPGPLAGGQGAASPAFGSPSGSGYFTTSSAALGGAASTGVGTPGTNGPSGTGRGGGGGSGGGFVGTPSTIGGNGGTMTANAANAGGPTVIHEFFAAYKGVTTAGYGSRATVGSGGGGGSCGKDTVNPTMREPGGGGGGSSGYLMVILARKIEWGASGVIVNRGSNGGAGGSCGTHTGNAGGGGGGGGGAGGITVLVYGESDEEPINPARFDVRGGNGGLGGTACAGGSNGGNGGNGADGMYVIFKVGA